MYEIEWDWIVDDVDWACVLFALVVKREVLVENETEIIRQHIESEGIRRTIYQLTLMPVQFHIIIGK